MAHRGDARAQSGADRIGEAQEIDDEGRFTAEGSVEAAEIGFFRQQLDQAQKPLHRGVQLAAFKHHRLGEIGSLEKLEAEHAAQLHLCLRFDVGGNQFAARGGQGTGDRLQTVGGNGVEVDHDPGGEIDQRPGSIADVGDTRQREGIAQALELTAAFEQGVVRKTLGGNLQHHCFQGQEFDEVARNELALDLDEGTHLPENIRQTKFRKCLGDDVCRRSCSVGGAGMVLPRVVEQQLVADQGLVLVQDGLSADKDFSQLVSRIVGRISHGFRKPGP